MTNPPLNPAATTADEDFSSPSNISEMAGLWQLESPPFENQPAEKIWVKLGTDGRLHGHSGTHDFSARFKLVEGCLEIDRWATQRKACLRIAAAYEEFSFLEAFAAGGAVRLSPPGRLPPRLLLIGADQQPKLSFVKIAPCAD